MKHALLLILALAAARLAGQNIGLHPPDVDWQQLQARHVRVLFPAGFGARARRVAGLIDRLAEQHDRSVGDRLYPFDLVLQTPNLTVNGYVSLAPFRSEFYTTPPQSFSRLSNTDWLDLLAIHEFRHVQQTSNERRGITGLVSILQGQYGWMALSGIATPNWFTEGDAVVAETAFTSGGRGRTPAFSGDLRALLGSGITYRYAKARNGSFRNLVPSHYVYGYGMTTFARERFGNDVWKPILAEGASFRGLIYPFSRALKRATGLSTRELYRATMEELEARQDSFLAARNLTTGDIIDNGDRDVRDYQFAGTDGQGRLLALRTSYREIPALVEVGSPDRVITRTAVQREPWLAVSDRFALWTRYSQDPRYTNQNYSDLEIYELSTGRKRRLTQHAKYLSARFSPDERRLAAVWYDILAGGPELHLLDAATGAVTARLTTDDANLAWPTFSADGRRVYYLSQNTAGVAVRYWEPDTGTEGELLPRSVAPIDMLSTADDGRLVYTGGYDGIDNVYALDPGTGGVTQLTSVPVGATFPHLADGTLYYANPTPRGERLSRLPTGEGAGLPGAVPVSDPRPGVFTRAAAFAAETTNLPAEVVAEDYPVRNFSNTLGGIRLHSWTFNGSYVTPGVAVDFGNALNTASATLSAQYNVNEARYSTGGRITYGGLFTVISLEGQYRDRNTIVQSERQDSLRFFSQEFNQFTIGPTLSVPLEWVDGIMTTRLVPSVGAQYYSLQDVESGALPADFTNLSLGLQFSTLQRLAYRQVQPRFGLTAGATYDRALGESSGSARFLWRSSVYLPSVFATHGVRLDLDGQTEGSQNLFQYPDVFRYARGFNAPLNDRVYRVGANYQLPVAYPDFGLLGITYFKRVRLNAFFDHSRFTLDFGDGLSFTENSAGAQVFFDNVWLNAQLITVGVEAAYRLSRDVFSSDPDDLQVRLLVSGSL